MTSTHDYEVDLSSLGAVSDVEPYTGSQPGTLKLTLSDGSYIGEDSFEQTEYDYSIMGIQLGEEKCVYVRPESAGPKVVVRSGSVRERRGDRSTRR